MFAGLLQPSDARNDSNILGAAILGLQCFTRRRTATRPSKCGAFAIKVQHFWWEKSGGNAAIVFKCRCGTFVAFFLTRTIVTERVN